MLVASQLAIAAAPELTPLMERVERLTTAIAEETSTVAARSGDLDLKRTSLRIRNCGSYPYSTAVGESDWPAGLLLADFSRGLETGLQCLGGEGPAGRLHVYHEYQAHRLLTLLESERIKTFRCVQDDMFAAAVATSPQGVTTTDPLHRQLSSIRHPAVLLDTFRIGGVLSRRHDDQTYRDFFHLAEEQILEHRNGQPLRPASLHRYRDRARLLFHEITHWLGHEHSAIYPDLAHLYESCCFGGSEYIADPASNRAYQHEACTILKDDELWSNSYSPYKQMRLWRHKGYDSLKSRMRADYAP
jgi:hypothetical protein